MRSTSLRWFSVALILLSVPLAGIPSGLERWDHLQWVADPSNDGDSFKLTDGEREYIFRLYFVDTNETSASSATMARRVREQTRYFGLDDHQQTIRFGREAARFTEKKLFQPFTVHTTFADAMGRSVMPRYYAFVTTADGEDLAELLVKNGLARSYGVGRSTPDGTPRDEHKAHLDALEVSAILGRKGIWAESNADKIAQLRREERLENAELQRIRKAATQRDLGTEGPLNINAANPEELVRLPGIGPALAERILRARPFEEPSELLGIRGIGPQTLSRLEPYLLFANE